MRNRVLIRFLQVELYLHTVIKEVYGNHCRNIFFPLLRDYAQAHINITNSGKAISGEKVC